MQYPTFLSGAPPFFAHLAGAHHMDATQKNPPTLQFPGDVEAVGPAEPIPYPEGMGQLQKGRLTIPVTVSFPDGFEQVFPVNSLVHLYRKPNGAVDMASLKFDIQGQPVSAPQQQQAGRRKSRRVRKSRKARSTRRNRRRAH